MLRKIRVALALICFVAATLLFLDFTGVLHHWLGWIAKIQLLPAVLAVIREDPMRMIFSIRQLIP